MYGSNRAVISRCKERTAGHRKEEDREERTEKLGGWVNANRLEEIERAGYKRDGRERKKILSRLA